MSESSIFLNNVKNRAKVLLMELYLLTCSGSNSVPTNSKHSNIYNPITQDVDSSPHDSNLFSKNCSNLTFKLSPEEEVIAKSAEAIEKSSAAFVNLYNLNKSYFNASDLEEENRSRALRIGNDYRFPSQSIIDLVTKEFDYQKKRKSQIITNIKQTLSELGYDLEYVVGNEDADFKIEDVDDVSSVKQLNPILKQVIITSYNILAIDANNTKEQLDSSGHLIISSEDYNKLEGAKFSKTDLYTIKD